jgi:hypothetical protein
VLVHVRDYDGEVKDSFMGIPIEVLEDA